MNSSIENNFAELFTGKVFANWSECDQFISDWCGNKGFGVVRDRVTKEGDKIRRRAYICEHEGKHIFNPNSNKATLSKKISCP